MIGECFVLFCLFIDGGDELVVIQMEREEKGKRE